MEQLHAMLIASAFTGVGSSIATTFVLSLVNRERLTALADRVRSLSSRLADLAGRVRELELWQARAEGRPPRL